MKNFLIFFILILSVYCYSQTSKFEINYFSAIDYGKGLEAKNRACVQDKNGVMYFGNAGRIIQYDGFNWSYIPVKQESAWIFSLAVSEENKIYVGAQNEFGYLAPDAVGKLTYISLSDSLTETDKIFSKIIRIHIINEEVIFQSEEAIYIFSKGKLNTIFPESSFHLSFIVNNEFYIRQRDLGLMKLDKNNLTLLPESDFLKNFGVFSIIENPDKDKLTIITREDGFWIYNKNTFEIERIITSDSILLKTSEIYGAIQLKDRNIALNTLSNGVIITDSRLNIISITNKNNGLKVNGVQSLLQDYQGNIWATLDNGIAYIKYSSPVSIFNSKNGITGIINEVVKYNNILFVGTTDGLFFQQNNHYFYSFVPFNNFTKSVNKFCVAKNYLLVGTQDGLFQVNNNEIIKLFNVEVNSLYYSEKLNVLFVSEKNKLVLYQYSGKWNKILEIPEISEAVIHFEENIENEGISLWMGTQLQGIIKLKYNTNNIYSIYKYDKNDGLTENLWAIPFKINNKVIFSQKTGLMQFTDEETLKKGLADSLKNKPEFYRGYFDFYNIDSLKDRLNIPFYFILDTKNKIYVNLDGEIGYFDKLNSLSWITKPFSLAEIGKANIFYHENDSICWIGGDDGLIMFNENKNKNYSLEFKTIITSVACNEDSLLYLGYSDYLNSVKNKSLKEYILGFEYNNLQFNYASPYFEGQERTLFSYMLVGSDTCYSQWRSENRVVFSNLHEGEYTFKVRAKNAYGSISSESTFSFTILSPWYRKILAYFLYFLIFILIVYAVIRFNSRRLIAKNKRLEEIILERTQEINQKNIVLEHQKEEILDSINYARRIQKAVLPDDNLTKDWLGEHFILFRPKDIVSGDFYWATKHNKYIFFCVADCTGHGVPGAFMSMLCVSFLNEVVLKEEISQSDEILNKLRKMIVDSLKQKGISGEQKDGMDITLCVLNSETSELQFSGANNPLYILRDKNKEPIQCDKHLESNDLILYEIKADSMPIAIYVNMDPFKQHTIKLLKDDRLFLFSDGYADQFGGPKGKKFMYKVFKTSLIETFSSSMEEQKILFEKRIDDWMAHINPESGEPFDQIDDICVMGVKI